MGAVRTVEYEAMVRDRSSKRLAELRKIYGFTQTALSDRLNISRQSLYYYEKGIRNIDICVLVKIKEVFGVSPEWILGIKDDDPKIRARQKYNI